MPAAGASVAGLPDTIRIRQPGLHPECVEWDAPRDRFLVSSATTGAITAVRDDGSHSVFIDDPEVVGSIGIHIDSAGGRLLVASSDMRVFEDSSFPGRAAVGIYDLESGERIRMVDLGALRPEGRHFANDLTVDGEGTVYVTDSFSPVIYRVALDGTASILVEDERLSGEPIGLNGIEFHPDGYLLAAVMGRRTLVRVPLDEPSGLTDVSLDEPVSA
ncbi:MAG: SMP-30/gluconolactonase/LRE family protein, partial [Gemmatimonadota bacterium]